MGKLRNTSPADANDPPAPNGGTAYLMIYNAVNTRGGLIHGELEDRWGEHCAIGSFFAVNKRVPLPLTIIDEVALVNDSVPTATAKARKAMVKRWLRWKLAQLGMPGFLKAPALAK